LIIKIGEIGLNEKNMPPTKGGAVSGSLPESRKHAGTLGTSCKKDGRYGACLRISTNSVSRRDLFVQWKRRANGRK
jgi:hypothetical protein